MKAVSRIIRGLLEHWDRLWFRTEWSGYVDVLRIGLGFATLCGWLSITPRLEELYSDQGWVDRQSLSYQHGNPFINSVLHLVTEPADLWAFHFVSVLAAALLMCGCLTSVTKWAVLVAHVSYCFRNPAATYGVDSLTSVLLVPLVASPAGRRWSIDSWIARRNGKAAMNPADEEWELMWAAACTRLVRLQICIIYFFAGTRKLRGQTWWSGDALWYSLTNYQFTAPLDVFAEHYYLTSLLCHATVVLEVTYPFLVWRPRFRPFMLAAAGIMHIGIGALMQMQLFAVVAVVAHLSFFDPRWLSGRRRAMRSASTGAPPDLGISGAPRSPVDPMNG